MFEPIETTDEISTRTVVLNSGVLYCKAIPNAVLMIFSYILINNYSISAVGLEDRGMVSWFLEEADFSFPKTAKIILGAKEHRV